MWTDEKLIFFIFNNDMTRKYAIILVSILHFHKVPRVWDHIILSEKKNKAITRNSDIQQGISPETKATHQSFFQKSYSTNLWKLLENQ